LVFVDESGIDHELVKQRAWSERGQKVIEERIGRTHTRTSMIAGLCAGKILALFCMKEHINGEVFYTWLKEHLIPKLRPGQMVILDNINFHHYVEIRMELEAKGCRLKYLPKYSPDLNPIEKYWAYVKEKIRKIYKEEDPFIEKLHKVLSLKYMSMLR
jgi:transposase